MHAYSQGSSSAVTHRGLRCPSPGHRTELLPMCTPSLSVVHTLSENMPRPLNGRLPCWGAQSLSAAVGTPFPVPGRLPPLPRGLSDSRRLHSCLVGEEWPQALPATAAGVLGASPLCQATLAPREGAQSATKPQGLEEVTAFGEPLLTKSFLMGIRGD